MSEVLEANSVLAPVEKKLPPAAGMGRIKGSQNRFNREVKEMILDALEGAGGVEYLIARAKDPRTAAAFLTLVGKVLPLQVTGANGMPLMQPHATLTIENEPTPKAPPEAR